ncbi:MAG: ATP-binding protein [Acetatifactor sp.]|nr:ATP-binding protein [Acetatifactor sp.]
MARTVGIGIQDFGKIIEKKCFYVDKTAFIKEWWENEDDVTLITRPRRFGKTLTMSMVEQFFSVEYADRGTVFENLAIWKEEKYRQLQGTYPVIALSFACVKETDFQNVRKRICSLIKELYNKYDFLLDSGYLNEDEKETYQKISAQMEDYTAMNSLKALSDYLSRYYGKKVLFLLDEYDTPMQEAYVNGCWKELAEFIRGLFNAAFKTNPYLDKAIMTGITRVSKESIFSDLNNLTVVTPMSDMYAQYFGFTEKEVFSALDEYGMGDKKDAVKQWYDGFTFGRRQDIYNPWSILNYLKIGKLAPYWANTSSNSLVGKLIREGSPDVKITMEKLLNGEAFSTQIDEQIIFNQLDADETAIWSLLLAGGYLKAAGPPEKGDFHEEVYPLSITNLEVRLMFEKMIQGWFGRCSGRYNRFIRSLLSGRLEDMNGYMSDIACELFSSFDGGTHPSEKGRPERFYHGFVLGLLVELKDKYAIISNGESGYGRYDIMLEPKHPDSDAFIIEFKVVDSQKGETLETGVVSALEQIEKMRYETALSKKGLAPERIRKYGFAFEGKKVLIGQG